MMMMLPRVTRNLTPLAGIRRNLVAIMMIQTPPLPPPSAAHQHIQTLNYHHYLFYPPPLFRRKYYSDDEEDRPTDADSDSDSDFKRTRKKKPNIFTDVDPDGAEAHMSLMEKFPYLAVPIKYKAKKKTVSFFHHRCSIVEWYQARLSKYHAEEDNPSWLEYIVVPAWHVLHTLLCCFLTCSVSSGIALSSNVNGHLLEHTWIDCDGQGLLYMPFHLTSSVDDSKMDLQVVSNFIYVVYNKRPLKEMENLSTIVAAADHWLDTTPTFFKNLCHFLPTFDPNKNCVEVTFNPPCMWRCFVAMEFVSKFAGYAYEANHAYILNRLMTEMGFSWVDKVPDKGNIIRDWFDEFGGSDTYKKNIDILKFYKDVEERYGGQSEEDVFVEFDNRFGILWILYRLCSEYFHSSCYQNTTGFRRDSRGYLLQWLGFTNLPEEEVRIRRSSVFDFQTPPPPPPDYLPNVYFRPNDLPYSPEDDTSLSDNEDSDLRPLQKPTRDCNQEVFDVRKRPLLRWYKARLSSKHHGKDNELWYRYIAASGFHILDTIFGFLRSSISSGVALSNSNLNCGNFIKHLWIEVDGEGQLYLPFRLITSVDDSKMDLQVASNFIYVFFNKRPLKEMENLSTIMAAADHWLDCTPRFFHSFYHFLPTFDPNKHCVEVTFNPPCVWNDHGGVQRFAHRFARYACDEENNAADILNRLMTEMGFSWLDKVPDKGNIIRDWFDKFGGSDTYKENIDLLRFFKDAIPRWGNERVFAEFDTRFGLLWILYRLCTEYFHSSCYQNTTGDRWNSTKDLLDWFGFNNIQDRKRFAPIRL